jgi:cytochrome c-550 PedF
MSSTSILSLRASLCALIVCAGLAGFSTIVAAHGDVAPQPVDISGLQPLGPEWLAENPYSGNPTAISIGKSGYNQNCARCHGLEVISGGLAPDLRYLEKGKPGDEWFIERIRHGARKPDGSTMMPPFEDILSQEAMWAIRSYLETRPPE